MPPPPPEGSIWPGISYRGRLTFQQLLGQAVADLSTTGYVSREKIEHWIVALRNAAERDLGPETQIDDAIRRALGSQFDRYIDGAKLIERVPEISRFNLQMIKPTLRPELDRRIAATADQIKIRRNSAIDETLARFNGWSTSIPPGGDETVNRRETKSAIGKSVAQFNYERRRVEIDQGHKLIANISEIVALDGGAIAGEWHDHGEHDKSYNARKDHLERSGKLFLVRDSWAHKAGLVKAIYGYTDEIDRPGQAVFCRCFYRWFMSPRRLPDEMLTRAGQEWIARSLAQRGMAA